MPSIVSPAEALGLAGAALEARCKRAAQNISDTTYRRIAERMRDDAVANGMLYERDGVMEPIRIMLRPVLARREQLTYVHHVCAQITEAVKQFPALYLAGDARARQLLRVSEAEEAWFREHWTPDHARHNPVYGRLDAVVDFAAANWQDTFKFMEPNLSGVGGIHYSPIAEQIVMRDIVPTLMAHDPELAIEMLPDQRDLFVQTLIDHARAIGRPTANICFIEPKYEDDGIAEQAVLKNFLSEKFGLRIVHADPRELYVKDGDVWYEGTRIDVAYRDYETRDQILLEGEIGKRLDGMRMLMRENRLVSSITGDFDHKSCFELLTDPAIAEELFSPEDCRLFERHILWTRLCGDRETSLPNHTRGSLLDYAKANRERLVLKPNRAYGGTGVTIGPSVSQAEWERLLADAAAKMDDPNESYVLQTVTRLPVLDFPVADKDGRIFSEPFYSVMGFAPTDNGLGIMCRVSQKEVVNVAQHGGMAAVLVVDAPKDLRIPQRSQKRDDGVLAALRVKIADLKRLEQASAVLEWDEETHMPPGGRAERGGQTGTLEAIRHGLLTSDELGDLIEEAALASHGDADWTRELYLLRRERKNALALPESLVRALSAAKSKSMGAWEEGRKQNAFAPFAAPFGELLKLVRERAACLSPGSDDYDALLDEYEPGMTRSRIQPLMMEMRERLIPLVRAASEKTKAAGKVMEGRRFAESAQWDLGKYLLKTIGFDFNRGRLDPTTHPFTMMVGVGDVRVTSRVTESNLTMCLLATMHEGGHALYDQGFRASDADSLLADGPGMGIHEGQSRLWENHVGRSRAFSEHIFPELTRLFGNALDGVTPETFWRSVNRVEAGLNRTAADELSYHLHIILRTELEAALIAGDLQVKDLEAAWNEKMKSLLGITPPGPKEGVLQDVHWAVGLIGYFPTYTIGSLYAAQLAETYAKGAPLADEIRSGKLGNLLGWLWQNVYQIGARLPAEDIIRNVTGTGLDTAAYFRHVESPERAWNS